MWIGITGAAFSGKSTVADYLCFDHCYASEYLAEPIRAALKAMFGLKDWHFSREHKEKVIEWIGKSPRELMQTLGTQGGRQLVNRQIWCTCLQRRIQKYPSYEVNFVIPDVRFEDEAQFIRRNGGLLWRVVRPGAETTEHSDHDSEQEYNRIVVDAEIINDGTMEQLREKISYSSVLPVGSRIGLFGGGADSLRR